MKNIIYNKNISAISPVDWNSADNMGIVTGRTSQTSRGSQSFNPWINPDYTFSVYQLLLGNNSLSKVEIVSALNSFNLAFRMFHYSYPNCPEKYNPKVYLGAVQSASINWNYDYQKPQKTGLPNLVPGQEKSGSWPRI